MKLSNGDIELLRIFFIVLSMSVTSALRILLSFLTLRSHRSPYIYSLAWQEDYQCHCPFQRTSFKFCWFSIFLFQKLQEASNSSIVLLLFFAFFNLLFWLWAFLSTPPQRISILAALSFVILLLYWSPVGLLVRCEGQSFSVSWWKCVFWYPLCLGKFVSVGPASSPLLGKTGKLGGNSLGGISPHRVRLAANMFSFRE